MSKKTNFIERKTFEEIIHNDPRNDDTQYEDIDTIYGDMSLLVVAWLACTPPEKLSSLYRELGWGGSASASAIHRAAKSWLNIHHPGRCPICPDGNET